jgi:hypothetical protein
MVLAAFDAELELDEATVVFKGGRRSELPI